MMFPLLSTPYGVKVCDELTAMHPVLRREAAACLQAVTAIGDGRLVDVEVAIVRSRRFLGLASGYVAGRRALLWPLLGELFPSAQAEFVLLTEHSVILENDLSGVKGAIDALSAALDAVAGAAVRGAALHAIRPTKILHDTLSLNLGDEELVLGSLFDGLSRRELARVRRTLEFRSRFHPAVGISESEVSRF